MIIPDINLLIYAYDSAAPQHAAARAWWEAALNGAEPVGLPVVVAAAYVRLATHPTLLARPVGVAQARAAVAAWQARPLVRLLATTPAVFTRALDLLERAGAGGNLTTDALIAAHAEEQGGTVYSNDHDFARFAPVPWVNPLAPKPR